MILALLSLVKPVARKLMKKGPGKLKESAIQEALSD